MAADLQPLVADFRTKVSLRAVATNQLSIAVDARHGHTGRRQQVVVVATVPGVYTVRAGSTREGR